MVIYLLISTFEFASFTSLNVLDKIIQIGCFSLFGENDLNQKTLYGDFSFPRLLRVKFTLLQNYDWNYIKRFLWFTPAVIYWQELNLT